MSDSSNFTNGDGGLRAILQAARAEAGCSMKDLTVLSGQRDPYRLDTPANHRDGRWLADHAGRFEDGEQIHLRGLHYKIASSEVVKPNGKRYVNDDADWVWVSETAGKAARWLGYVAFEAIKDNRNAPPIIRPFDDADLEPFLRTGVEIEIPETIEPRIGIAGFVGRQPYRLAIFGEKSSLDPIVRPIADSRRADLYLMTGEISDTAIFRMAEVGARDGRPLVVFTICDCDPAGWQMMLSIARKLQAFRDLLFPELRFQLRQVGLTPEQVRTYGLPSTPLKETERRADRWRELFGVEQTEIDALSALQPELLARIVRDAMAPFHDASLARRVSDARTDWERRAQVELERQLGPEHVDRIRADATDRLAAMRDEIEAINGALTIDIGEIDLPEVVIPEPELNGGPNGLPLIDSGWPWTEQTRRLIAFKSYEIEG